VFDLINGLPIHPLVVHAVVVLLPLACVGTVAIALRPAWRERYGVLVVAAAAVSTALLPVATSSGEELERHVGDPGQHAELGDQLIWFAIPLLALALALVWLERRRRRDQAPGNVDGTVDGTSTRTRAVHVVAVLAVVAALATSVQVYRVGDSGARAAWGDQVAGSGGSGGS
jgi:uncharacterized membrane protein